MQVSSYLTIGAIAELLDRPHWRVRRCVDSLGDEIPRAGGYRLVPRSLLGRIAAELERRDRIAASNGEVATEEAGQ